MLQISPLKSSKSDWRPTNIWFRWVAAAMILVVLAIGLAFWNTRRPTAVRYVTSLVDQGSLVRVVTATGTVNPVLTVVVGTYVSGVIQNLFCDYNTQVRAGQVCAKVDPRPYQATLDQRSAQLQHDQAVLDKDRANLARYQQLAAQNAIARQQAEDQSYLVDQDAATVKLDQALVESAKLNLYYTDIISPVNGTVVSRSVTGGQTVAASFQTPTLFLIATDLKQMEVDTNVSEGDMGGIQEGETATFTVDAFPKRIFQGKVTQVRKSPQTVQNVVTYAVVIGVDNNDLALAPGMTAATQIITDQRADVLRVPNQALRYVPGGLPAVERGRARPSANGRPHVFVLRDDRPVALSVVPGLSDDNFTEIVGGDVRVGDRVIIAESGTPVSTRPSSFPPPRL